MNTLRVIVWVVVVLCVVAAPGIAAAGSPSTEATSPTGVFGPYTPPPCTTPIFNDVPCSNYFSAWIDQLYLDQVSTGCPFPNFCPDQYVTRGQMAAFLERSMRGTSSWPPNTQLVWAVKNADGTANTAASGQALLAALAAIPTSGNDAPSPNNRWLVRIGPGIFDIGTATLAMRSYVDIEGSGTLTTQITGSASDNVVVTGANASELRRLSVFHFGSSNQAIAASTNGASLTVRECLLSGLNGSGLTAGVWVNGGSLVADRSTLRASGYGGALAYGVYATGSGVADVEDGFVSADQAVTRKAGIYAGTSALVRLNRTTVQALDAGAYTLFAESGGQVSASFSKLLWGTSSGTVSCAASVDEGNVFYASTCP